MQTILASLRGLEGVHGAFVSDGAGHLVGYDAEAIYDTELLTQVSHAIVAAIDSIKLLYEDWEQVQAQFTDGHILARQVTVGPDGASLVLALLADTRLNPSFATISIRVAVQKLKALLAKGGIAALSASGSEPPPGGPAPVASSFASSSIVPGAPLGVGSPGPAASGLSTGGAAGAPAVRASELASSGMTWSGLGSAPAFGSSSVSVADPESSGVLTVVTKALARSAGPMAKVLVKEAILRVCSDRPFSREATERLVAELEKNIRNPSDARQFRDAVRKGL